LIKSKRLIATLVLAVFTMSLILAFSLAGADKAKAASNKVTLRFMWWGGEARHKATLAAIQAYMKKYPNVRINAEYGGIEGYMQKLITQLVGRTAPDIIQIDVTWIGELSAQGDFFADLKTFKEVNLKPFEEKFLKDWCYSSGKLIGLPTGVNASAIHYNKDFFKKFGIPENKTWTWEDILTTAEKIHKKDKNYYLLNFDATVCYYLLKTYVLQKKGGKWINDDYTMGFDRKTLIEAFTYIDKLFKVGAIQPFSESAPFQGKPEQNPKWLKGELGMLWNWTSTFAANKANIPSLSMTMIPIMKNAKSTAVTVRPSQLLAVNKLSKNAKEAAKFINWFLNDKQAALILKDVRGVPASSTARDALEKEKALDPVITQITSEALKRAAPPENALSQNQELEKIATDVIQQLAYNQLTPVQAADKLMALYKQKLNEIKRLQSR